MQDLIARGKADAVIVSGSATGQPIDLGTLSIVKDAAGATPVLVGSGVTAESIHQLLPYANGAIVGSSLKEDGSVRKPVDVARVQGLVSAAHRS